MAEIEISVVVGQCLRRRINSIHAMRREVAAWQTRRDYLHAKVNWHFATEDAHIKLRRLYPSVEPC